MSGFLAARFVCLLHLAQLWAASAAAGLHNVQLPLQKVAHSDWGLVSGSALGKQQDLKSIRKFLIIFLGDMYLGG